MFACANVSHALRFHIIRDAHRHLVHDAAGRPYRFFPGKSPVQLPKLLGAVVRCSGLFPLPRKTQRKEERNQFKIKVCFVKIICFPLLAREITSRAVALYLFFHFFQLHLIMLILHYVEAVLGVVMGKPSSKSMPQYGAVVAAGPQVPDASRQLFSTSTLRAA